MKNIAQSWGTLFLMAVVAASMPWLVDRSTMRLLTEFFLLLALAQTWNLLAGTTGIISIGHQAFIGIGAYTLVILGLKAGWSAFVLVPVAGLTGLIVAVPTAFLLFRLSGPHFAVGTWVAAEVFRLTIANISWVGGGSGLSVTQIFAGIPPFTRETALYFLAVTFGLFGTVALWRLLRSDVGLALAAIRDSERASGSLGIDVRRMKWGVYIGTCVLTAMIGASLFMTKLRVAPDAAFSIDWSATMFFIVIIGGLGTLEGPVIGAFVYFLLRDCMPDLGPLRMIVIGATAIVVMRIDRHGLWGLISNRLGFSLFPLRRNPPWPVSEASL